MYFFLLQLCVKVTLCEDQGVKVGWGHRRQVLQSQKQAFLPFEWQAMPEV